MAFLSGTRRRQRIDKMRRKYLSQIRDKTTARELRKTDLVNMPNRKFRATMIRIFTGLEKRMERMEAISLTITTKIKMF